MLGQIQDAATDAADSQLQGADTFVESAVHQNQARAVRPSQVDLPYGAFPSNNRIDQVVSTASYTRTNGTTGGESGWGRVAVPHGTSQR